MIGGMMGAGQLPKHDNWIGALAGGAGQAISSTYGAVKTAVTGEMEVPKFNGKGTENVEVHGDMRTFQLKHVPDMIAGAFRNHTFSVREPEKFQQMQDAIKTFQSSPQAQAGGVTPH